MVSVKNFSAGELLEPFLPDRLKRELRRISVSRLAYHSGRVVPGTLFFCLSGSKADGHDYAAEAVSRGAAALVVSRRIGPVAAGVPVIAVEDSRLALSAAAAHFYGYPSDRMKTMGITGTDGKTTTSYFIASIFEAAGYRTAIMGSNGFILKGQRKQFGLTTPQSLDLQEYLHLSLQEGAAGAVVEVSSHALVQQRVAHCFFDCAAFTNLSGEHLDYHRTMPQYLEAKSRLLGLLKRGRSAGGVVLNADDYYYRELSARAAHLPQLTYGVTAAGAGIKAVGLRQDESGRYSFNLLGWPEPFPVELRLPGRFNLYNALAAAAVARREGLDPAAVARGLASLRQVPGRFEEYETPVGFTVIIDFAHTPEGLEQVLRLLSGRRARRRITLFGCPGERDRRKRPLMGKIAELYSDMVILTADNPAGEEAGAIIEDIRRGMSTDPLIIPDRREAVFHALSTAAPGDLVLLAGKGAEEYQIIGERAVPYSDRQAVADYLAERGFGGG